MEPFSALLAGNAPVTRSFNVFFNLRLNKWLSKLWYGWWFETPSRPFWRQCYDIKVAEMCSKLVQDLKSVAQWWRKRRSFDPCLDSIKALRSRQNGRHLADDISKCIFPKENIRIKIRISLKIVPKGRINNEPALVPIMVWRPILNIDSLVYWRIHASSGLNDLKMGPRWPYDCW